MSLQPSASLSHAANIPQLQAANKKDVHEDVFIYSSIRPGDPSWQPLLVDYGGLFSVVLLLELPNAAFGIHNLLLACIERVAGGANFHMQFLPQGRAGDKRISACTDDLELLVFRVYIGFHAQVSIVTGCKNGCE